MTSAMARPCTSSTAKSAMATGYCVAPVPEISTRSCAWAGCHANTAAATISTVNSAPYMRASPGERARLKAGVMVSNLLSVIHSVHDINDGLVAARRGFGERVATPDAGFHGTVEPCVARRRGEAHTGYPAV